MNHGDQTIPFAMSFISKTCHVKKKNTVTLDSLWKDETAVVVFFRRWGCLFCRVWAKEISAIKEILDANNVKLIGVGLETDTVKDFVDGKFFKGELYADVDKKTYSAMGFKRFNYITVLGSLLTGESRAAISKGRELNLPGDLKGDGLQNGGALVVKKGGELLYSFRQERPAEHVKNSKFLEVLGIPAPEGIDEKVAQ